MKLTKINGSKIISLCSPKTYSNTAQNIVVTSSPFSAIGTDEIVSGKLEERLPTVALYHISAEPLFSLVIMTNLSSFNICMSIMNHGVVKSKDPVPVVLKST